MLEAKARQGELKEEPGNSGEHPQSHKQHTECLQHPDEGNKLEKYLSCGVREVG